MTPPNISTRPAATPQPATPARREASWTQAAEARLLPDRWHVLLQSASGERLVSGSAIHEPLSLTFSPDPADATSPLGDDGLKLSDDVRWTVPVMVNAVLCGNGFSVHQIRIAGVRVRIVRRIVAARNVQPDAMSLLKQIARRGHVDTQLVDLAGGHEPALGKTVAISRSQDTV